MADFTVKGRVIDTHQAPLPDLRVRVMHRVELRRTEHQLAEARTDDGGRFQLGLEQAQLKRVLGRVRGAPKIFLAFDRPDGELLYATRETPVAWQLEFRVYLGGGVAVADAPDIYASGMRRFVAATRDADLGSRAMKSMVGDETTEQSGKSGAWRRNAAVLQQYSELGDSVNMMFGAIDGVLSDATHGTPVKLVGYDGAQVPRRAWTGPDNQAIIWPRKEPLPWE
jgi:hypothetical protein